MGNESSVRPTKEQAEWLKNNNEYQCSEAAKAIRSSDMFLLSIGAGFSADSGLAVYNDIANVPAYHNLGLDYHDLCTVDWIESNPGIFYGFWGKCFNDYRTTPPHRGYSIIQSWKEKYYSTSPYQPPDSFNNEFSRLYSILWNQFISSTNKDNALSDPIISPFFLFSSNVDSHPTVSGYHTHEVLEIHGSLENWQCSSNVCKGSIMNDGEPKKVWTAPKNFRFHVNEEVMIAEDISHPTADLEHGFTSNFPKCIHCNALARPNVLMFGDPSWEEDSIANQRYVLWNDMMSQYMERGKKVVILEIGCGVNVPTVRCNSERIVRSAPPGTVTLIRINPDYPLPSDLVDQSQNQIISIMGRGLASIEKIDKYLQDPHLSRKQETPTSPLPPSAQDESDE